VINEKILMRKKTCFKKASYLFEYEVSAKPVFLFLKFYISMYNQ
jgi:hypothetical protein